ncbi:MAG: GNAT family N-acetyltransferase [Gammaproteobacteria bacterium]|nr:GNAT family N-acetyltransferase [Gammaproteobacteria bacterium]
MIYEISGLDDATNYLKDGPLQMHQEHGFGLNRVVTRDMDISAGICGLLQRQSLDNVDLGFAFLPAFRNRGYAYKAACAVLQHGFEVLDLARIAAILDQSNITSRNLLCKLGFNIEK